MGYDGFVLPQDILASVIRDVGGGFIAGHSLIGSLLSVCRPGHYLIGSLLSVCHPKVGTCGILLNVCVMLVLSLIHI